MKRQEIAVGSGVTEMNAGWYYVEKVDDYYVVENLYAVQFHGEASRRLGRRTALRKQGFTGSGKPKKTIACSASATVLCRPLDEERRREEDFFGKIRPRGKNGKKRPSTAFLYTIFPFV